jgi:hypothetical protein
MKNIRIINAVTFLKIDFCKSLTPLKVKTKENHFSIYKLPLLFCPLRFFEIKIILLGIFCKNIKIYCYRIIFIIFTMCVEKQKKRITIT